MPHNVVWNWSPRTAWNRHCSFLELSLREFLRLQTRLLMEHLHGLPDRALARQWLPGGVPASLQTFRRTLPLTGPRDYAPLLGPQAGPDAPAGEHRRVPSRSVGPGAWHVPYTIRGWAAAADTLMAAFLLASAQRKGEVNLRPGDRALYPREQLGGLIGRLGVEVTRRFGILGVAGVGEAEAAPPLPASAVRLLPDPGLLNHRGWHDGRGLLPRLVSWGSASAEPPDRSALQIHATAEGGIMALQGWNRRGMTLVPHASFFEFIPEAESWASRADPAHQPAVLLMNELEPDQRYELVTTSFYGMPFLRYRTGQLVRVVELEDAQLGCRLPQFKLEGRCDDRLDLDGSALLGEPAIAGALTDCQVGCMDWVVRTETHRGRPWTHLYGEFQGELTAGEIAHVVAGRLMAAAGYRPAPDASAAVHPVWVTRLPAGALEHRRHGTGIAQHPAGLPRVNASDALVAGLYSSAEIATLQPFSPGTPG